MISITGGVSLYDDTGDYRRAQVFVGADGALWAMLSIDRFLGLGPTTRLLGVTRDAIESALPGEQIPVTVVMQSAEPFEGTLVVFDPALD